MSEKLNLVHSPDSQDPKPLNTFQKKFFNTLLKQTGGQNFEIWLNEVRNEGKLTKGK